MSYEVKFDDRRDVLNTNLGECKIPTALDMPPINAIMPTIPPLLNAVCNATGCTSGSFP
ncbi:MAG: hypothetical protein J7M32_05865 [Deltaproteobacteria bacterium]|nr:hypothetical protein [Deltaproteobacteria bacterium]